MGKKSNSYQAGTWWIYKSHIIEWYDCDRGNCLKTPQSPTLPFSLTAVETWSRADPLVDTWPYCLHNMELADFQPADFVSIKEHTDCPNFPKPSQGRFLHFLLHSFPSGKQLQCVFPTGWKWAFKGHYCIGQQPSILRLPLAHSQCQGLARGYIQR